MNTQIYLMMQPLVVGREQCEKNEELYFNVIVEGDLHSLKLSDIEDELSGTIISNVMDYADIAYNNNYRVVTATKTNKKPSIEFAKSPKDIQNEKEAKEQAILAIKKAKAEAAFLKKKESKLNKIINSPKEIELLKGKSINIEDDGMITINLPELNVSDSIDISPLWSIIEKNFLGKIKKGDSISLLDDYGNKAIEIIGGNFLNAGVSEVGIYNKKKMVPKEERNMWNSDQGKKGGFFLREEGDIHIGDMKRTIFIVIQTKYLLKMALKNKLSLQSIMSEKLIK